VEILKYSFRKSECVNGFLSNLLRVQKQLLSSCYRLQIYVILKEMFTFNNSCYAYALTQLSNLYADMNTILVFSS
jgi:hypothetical protein